VLSRSQGIRGGQEPFGFHLHTKLPADKEHRELLDMADYKEAMDFFFEEIERIIKNEE